MTAALILLGLLGQAAAPASSLPADLTAVRAQILDGRIDAAIEQLAGLPADEPAVRYLTGLAHYHRDDHVRAIEYLAPVAQALPAGSLERREAIQVLGLSYYVAGRLREALPLLEQTRQWARDNSELGHILGLTYVQTQQPDKARTVVAETFGVAPTSAAAHLYTAQLMIRMEFHEAAGKELERALALDPGIPHAHALLGQLAVHRARLDDAVALFRKAIEISPLDAMAHYRLGEAYARQQRWSEAIEALQHSIWINPYFSGPYIVLGRAYMTRGQPSTAEGLLRRAIEYDPNNKSAHYLLGQALQKLGREDDAAKAFERAESLSDAQPQR